MTSKRYQTALKFIGAFEDLSIDTFLALQTPTCRHVFAPASLPPPAPLDNAGFAAHQTGLRTILEAFPVRAKEIIEDQEKNQVVIWATSETKFFDAVKDSGLSDDEWIYRGEYMFILTMDESQEKIERVIEFLDSKATERLRVLIRRAKDNKQKIDGVRVEGHFD
jgi:hypothetical protein